MYMYIYININIDNKQMLQSKVLEKFIRSKLQDKLKTFFQLDSSTIQGFTIRNLVMKPDLLNQLSQLIHVPLILISGSIQSVSLNIPWESLLTASKDNPVAVVLKGIKICAKLPDQLQRMYVVTRKKKIVQKFTQQFNTKTTSRLTFLNKLRQHFLGSICVEVSNLQIQINIQMKHSLIGTLSVSYLKFQKDIKTDNTKFQIRDLSLGYKLAKQTKLEYIINNADMTLTGTKGNDQSVKNLQTNNLQLSFNNQNFNDVRRIIELIKWHNSFVNIPYHLWPLKPHILGQVKPIKKLIYVANIIKYKTSQLKPKSIRKILQTRRKHIKLFELFRKDPSNITMKQQLNQLESGIETWRVQQYRKFCLLWAKKFPNKTHSNMAEKKEITDTKLNWLSYWFPKSQQNVLNELQNCLQSNAPTMYKKYFTFSIQTIKIKLSIQSLTGKQPFLNLISIGNMFTNTSIPISIGEHKQINYESTKKVTVNKMMVEFDKYAGHHQDHKYMMAEASGGSVLEEDQFQDIQNFIQCQFTKNNTQIKILPLRVRLNEDTLQKMSVFKFQRIHNTFQSAQTLVLQQNTFQEIQNKKQHKILNLQTSIYVTVPQNMFQKQCEQLQISLSDINFTKQQDRQSLKIDSIVVNASLIFQDKDSRSHQNQSSHHIMEQSIPQDKSRQQTIQLLKTSLVMNKQIHNLIEKLNWYVSYVKVQMSSMQHLKQLIRLAAKLKPKPKNKKPLYKLKHLRRKQSIGQQFIDACQNLQEHLIKSSAISEKTKIQRYIVKDKRTVENTFQMQGLKILFQSSQIQLSKWTIKIFELTDHQKIISDEEKNINIRIFNMKNSIKNINDISKQLQRRLQLKSKNEEIDDKKTDINNKIIQFNDLNIYIEVLYNNLPKIVAEINNINLGINGDKNLKAQLNFGLAITPKKKQNISKQKDIKVIKQYLIQPFKILYFHEKQYNKDERHIKINQLNINIKPNLFIELGNLFDKLNTPEKLKIEIINSTANHINISTTGNIYKQYWPNSTVISENYQCDIILFGKKQTLNLQPTTGLQKIKLTKNLNMLKTMQTQYIFHIQSNFRITNRQQKTVWVRVITNKLVSQLRKNSMRQAGLVTFQHLSTAYMEQMDNQDEFTTRKGSNLKRSTSLHAQMMEDNIDDNTDQIKEDQIKMKKATIVRTLGNPNINPKIMDKAEKDIKKTQSNSSNSNSNNNSQNAQPILQLRKPGSHKQTNSSQKLNMIGGLTKQKSIQNTAYKPINKNQILFTQIAPQQTIQMLLSSQDYYIQLIQFDKKGQIMQKYHIFKVSQVLKDGHQKLLNSHLFNSWEQQKQISSSLVIATNVVADQKNAQNTIYNLQILSPVVMVNKMPVQIQFRFSKQQIDLLQVMNSAGKQIRKRSFQTVGLQRIQPFKIDRINKTQYKQISQAEICVGEYYKKFRLDHIIQNLKQPQQKIDIRITDHLCLNNGAHEIQMGIQIRILKYVMKITVFPQFIFVNLTPINMSLQIQQQNYNYSAIKMAPLKQNKYYKSFIKMSNQKLCNYKILQSLFKLYEQNINTFTGSFDEQTKRSVKYGDHWNYNTSKIFNTYEVIENNRGRQKIVSYGSKQNKMVVRKIKIDDKPINLVLFMPSLFIINKSDWSFFIKVQGQIPKKLQKHSTEYIMINDTIGVQACEEQQQIAFNQWMKITLNTLGTIYYAKEMTSSSGYQSRQYELRKKRLKKAPKLFFRIVMTKYEYGHQILIEQSQYPPVTFINQCKSRVQISELKQNIKQEMQMNQMAEYASKIPHHTPFFGLSMVQNYQFFKLGEFSLEQPNGQKIFRNRVKITIEQYKDKKIVVIEDIKQQKMLKNQSNIRNELLLQKLSRTFVIINNIQISIMTRNNKQLSCACIKGVQIHHESKNTKKYVKLNINDAQIISYNGLQPKHLFYCKQDSHLGISNMEVLNYFKKKPIAINQSLKIGLNSSLNLNATMNASNSNCSSNQPQAQVIANKAVLILDLIIDYHRHATILQKCKVTLSPIVIVINANTLIDYLKFYYKELNELMTTIKKHEVGRMIIRQIKQAINPTSHDNIKNNIQKNGDNVASNLIRRNSININYINNINRVNSQINNNNLNRQGSINIPNNSSAQSPHSKQMKLQHRHSMESAQLSGSSNSENDVDFLNRGFVIQNFSWEGLKITIKFQHLDHLQYFMNNKQIKYLLKFITWIGDLRPIEFSPTQVQYQQYTIMKLLQLIDLKKLLRQVSQMFLQYPLQQFYNIMSFIIKFVGFNDLEESGQQWQTLKKLGKSAFKMSKKIFSYNNNNSTYIVTGDGQLKQNKQYLQQFMQQNINDPNIIQKILRFKYQQWRYKQQTNQQKLITKIHRLQRYNLPLQLQPYQENKARIQIAINDHCGNKIFRQITKCIQINKDVIIGLTQDWFVLYFFDKEQWIVTKPQEVLDIYIQKIQNQNKNKFTVNLNFAANFTSKQLVIILSVERKNTKNQMSKIQKYHFGDLLINQTDVQSVQQYLNQLKLSSVY